MSECAFQRVNCVPPSAAPLHLPSLSPDDVSPGSGELDSPDSDMEEQ